MAVIPLEVVIHLIIAIPLILYSAYHTFLFAEHVLMGECIYNLFCINSIYVNICTVCFAFTLRYNNTATIYMGAIVQRRQRHIWHISWKHLTRELGDRCPRPLRHRAISYFKILYTIVNLPQPRSMRRQTWKFPFSPALTRFVSRHFSQYCVRRARSPKSTSCRRVPCCFPVEVSHAVFLSKCPTCCYSICYTRHVWWKYSICLYLFLIWNLIMLGKKPKRSSLGNV